ncbi:ABC transporter ATP-binding protein [uncultured Martelella sp.]|uniref:ABC transporter ATP-binding protein n=1 Tax=uncultured Martelella sp. TaxID=392331 RepID=UPI0029C727BA|nr:ABC transporter ATP-binding protein [uncultured Martelella sp.]
MTETPAKQKPVIELEDVNVTFGTEEQKTVALAQTSLSINNGEFVALVGPSGCGKSTILKLIAGTLSPSEGHIFVAGREIGANDVRIGMAFQNPTLLPWLNIRDNVMMPLKIVAPYKRSFRQKRNGEYRDRAEALLKTVGLDGFGDKFPWQLSGGMQQRASLCRALIHEPTLLLLDEPFGALDQFTREELWEIMQNLWMETRPTVLLVTHDLKEASYLASRICVMQARPGRIIEDSAIEFARPRTIDISFDPEFVSLTQRLRDRIVQARSPKEHQI